MPDPSNPRVMPQWIPPGENPEEELPEALRASADPRVRRVWVAQLTATSAASGIRWVPVSLVKEPWN